MSLYEMVFPNKKVVTRVGGIHVSKDQHGVKFVTSVVLDRNSDGVIVAFDMRRWRSANITSRNTREALSVGILDAASFLQYMYKKDGVLFDAFGYDAWSVDPIVLRNAEPIVGNDGKNALVDVKQSPSNLKSLMDELEKDMAAIEHNSGGRSFISDEGQVRQTKDNIRTVRALTNAYGAARNVNKERV